MDWVVILGPVPTYRAVATGTTRLAVAAGAPGADGNGPKLVLRQSVAAHDQSEKASARPATATATATAATRSGTTTMI
jgi:hypothetical protein